MDTKSTKFKYSFTAKFLSFILAILFAFSFIFCTVGFVMNAYLYGTKNYLEGKYGTYYTSSAFNDRFTTDIFNITNTARGDSQKAEEAFNSSRDKIIKSAVDSYLDSKAEIIKNELTYAVNNYDESYFNYEYSADSVTIPETSTVSESGSTATETTVIAGDIIDSDIPKNIQLAQQILAVSSGRDFLNYETLVRQEAFDENKFTYTADVTSDNGYSTEISLDIENYSYSENQVKSQLLDQYHFAQENCTNELDLDYQSNVDTISGYENLKYSITLDNGTVLTNSDTPITQSVLSSNPVSVVCENGKVTANGVDASTETYVKNQLSDTNAKKIVLYIDDKMPGEDSYASIKSAFDSNRKYPAKVLLACLTVSFFALIATVIIFTSLAGHKYGEDKPVTARIDKLPTDVHFILSFGLIAAALFFYVVVLKEIDFRTWFFFSMYLPVTTAAVGSLCSMIGLEWLSSTARIVKSDSQYFGSALLVKLFRTIVRGIRNLRLALSYKPKKFKRNTILLTCGYIFVNMIFALCSAVSADSGFAFIFILAIIIFNIICGYFIIKYVKHLDMIISAASEHTSVDFGKDKVEPSLQTLYSSLTDTNEALEKAVASAVKDEHLKTELITNVSHDLKTPLTSIISYSDLLKKCGITDENALNYIGILNEQSIKLKRLIEDLIEASKVSTGNVTLNKAPLNLCELAAQAMAEFVPEMETNGNAVVFSEPEDAPVIFADGSKTYRVISNLLSNAKKYSAQNTRVYVSVYGGINYGCFEIKNVSNDALNISAEELTERFVRGDQSRSKKEGNGLGLSIAKDLCELQDGELKINIDGDLFKVTVKLPAYHETPEEAPEYEIPEEETPEMP